jgi:hypothetical protein
MLSPERMNALCRFSLLPGLNAADIRVARRKAKRRRGLSALSPAAASLSRVKGLAGGLRRADPPALLQS